MEPLTGQAVAALLEAKGASLSPGESGTLAAYIDLLEQWNRVHNLTGIRSRAELIDRHLVESLALRQFVIGPAAADVGSGGGLPGIPLAVCLPDIAFTLIESRRKRASFLRHVAAALALHNVSVAHSRAEQVTTGPFRTVLARAVAPPAELLALTARLIEPSGRLVLLTSREKAGEVIAIADGFRELAVESPVIDLRSRVVVLEREPVS